MDADPNTRISGFVTGIYGILKKFPHQDGETVAGISLTG